MPSISRALSRHTFGRYFAKAAGLSAGPRFPASPRTFTARISWCWRCFRKTNRSAAGFSSRRSACDFRDCPRASAGWAMASAHKFGVALNDLVARGELKAPIVIGRDHLGLRFGGFALPRNGKHARRLGRDCRLAFFKCAAQHRQRRHLGFHSQWRRRGHRLRAARRAGDRSRRHEEMEKRIERVLTNDPGIGIARHADAGYPDAIAFAQKSQIKIPMPSHPSHNQPNARPTDTTDKKEKL